MAGTLYVRESGQGGREFLDTVRRAPFGQLEGKVLGVEIGEFQGGALVSHEFAFPGRGKFCWPPSTRRNSRRRLFDGYGDPQGERPNPSDSPIVLTAEQGGVAVLGNYDGQGLSFLLRTEKRRRAMPHTRDFRPIKWARGRLLDLVRRGGIFREQPYPRWISFDDFAPEAPYHQIRMKVHDPIDRRELRDEVKGRSKRGMGVLVMRPFFTFGQGVLENCVRRIERVAQVKEG